MWPPPQWGPRGGPNGQIVSVKRAADGRGQRSRKIIDENREKYRAKKGCLRNISKDSKGATFVILINHVSGSIRKERLSPTSKARSEASRNKFMEKGGMPDRVKSFREINSREDRPRARPGFVKPIRNKLRKIRNLIWSGPSRAKPAWRGERMELDSTKKSKRDSMMRSNTFDTQEVREIGRKKARESRGFPILWMGTIANVFQMEQKESKVQEALKI